LQSGKIERFFRTVRTRFLPGIGDGALTLDELNERFSEWLEHDHQNRVHSVTAMTPFNRFAANLEMIRAAPADLDDHFRTDVRRRVGKDRIINIDGTLFEAPTQLIGEQVALLFHKEQPQRVDTGKLLVARLERDKCSLEKEGGTGAGQSSSKQKST
jgi:hypothetical protein